MQLACSAAGAHVRHWGHSRFAHTQLWCLSTHSSDVCPHTVPMFARTHTLRCLSTFVFQSCAGTSYAPEGKVLDACTAAEVAFPADLPCLLQVGCLPLPPCTCAACMLPGFFPRSVAHAALPVCRWAACCCPWPCPSAPTIHRCVLLLPCHDSRPHSAQS